MTIRNISELREHAIATLGKLQAKKIDVVEAGVTGKLYENIISALKTEMEYHKMLGQEPRINFLEGAEVGKTVKGAVKELPSGRIKSLARK